MIRFEKIGTDVEGMVAKVTDPKRIIPLRPGMVEGEKAHPYLISEYHNVGIQLDNVLFEVTFDPSHKADLFEERCAVAKRHVAGYLDNKGLVPHYKSSHWFEEEELLFPHAMVAGCEPDYPAIANEEPPVFNFDIFKVLRTGSGHLHFQLSEDVSRENIIQYVRGLDQCIAAYLCTLHNDSDRRKLYGQAGRFRFKPDYPGFEYRTPDNYWFTQSSILAEPIFNAVKDMFDIQPNDSKWDKVNEYHTDMAKAINIGDITTVSALMELFDFPRLVDYVDPHLTGLLKSGTVPEKKVQNKLGTVQFFNASTSYYDMLDAATHAMPDEWWSPTEGTVHEDL